MLFKRFHLLRILLKISNFDARRPRTRNVKRDVKLAICKIANWEKGTYYVF